MKWNNHRCLHSGRNDLRINFHENRFYYQEIAKGIIIITTVVIDLYRQKIKSESM